MKNPIRHRVGLLSAGACAVLLAGCATVSPEEMDTQLADIRSEMQSQDEELATRLDNVENSVAQLEQRMDALNSELEDMADEYATTVQRLESSLRFAAPVHFEFDASEVRSQDMEILRRFAADAVRSVLVERGNLPANRVRAVSYGEDTRRLINSGAAGSDNADAMANRRVALVVEHATQGGSMMRSSGETE